MDNSSGDPWPIVSRRSTSRGSGMRGTLEATVCVWRYVGDERWHTCDIAFLGGPGPDATRVRHSPAP
jgi:hypothetical protein